MSTLAKYRASGHILYNWLVLARTRKN